MLQRRFLHTESSTLGKFNLKSNRNKWSIKQVTKSNFKDVLEEVKLRILGADYVAVGMQRTGAYTAAWQKAQPFDTAEIAYLKAKRAAERFQVVQFGLCAFSVRASEVTAFPYNFHLFPRDELKNGMPSYSFACQTSYLTTMARIGFNFNTCIYDGISYLSRTQELAAKHQMGNPMLGHTIRPSPASSVADAVFVERIKSRVRTWRNACVNSKAQTQEPLVRSLRKIVFGEEFGSRPCMDIDVCSERQVQLVLEVLKEFSDDVVSLLIPANRGAIQGVRVVLTSSKEDKSLFEGELKNAEEEQSRHARGFREVIDMISASQKPVVALNALDDFTFIHSKFLSPLPSNIEEFKHSLKSSFPYILDLNHLLKEIFPLKSFNNMHAALTYMRTQFSSAIDFKFPYEGLFCETNEGKIHGHSVVRICQLFAKLHSMLKLNPENLKNDSFDASISFKNYAYNFNPGHTSSLENSDEDNVSVSSKNTRKLNSKDLVFLWGFGNHLSARELKQRLIQSNEELSQDVDIRLVDKGFAVTAFWKPGLSRIFLDAINGRGGQIGGLKEMVSEGLRAGNYESYRRVCQKERWDFDIRDSMDEEEESSRLSENLKVDEESKSAFEIYWEKENAINLDDT